VDPEGLPLRIAGTSAHVEDGYWVANRRAGRYRFPVVRDSHLAQAVLSAVSRVRRREAGRAPIYNELMYRQNYLERTEAAVDVVQGLFSAMKTSVEERGGRLVVVMIPAYEQVCPELVFGDSGVDSGLDLLKPQREFARFFGEQGIDYVDLLPALRELATTEELYLPYDHHWTVRGNEIVGALLASRLLATGAVETTKRF
jgi:hypothetical protein